MDRDAILALLEQAYEARRTENIEAIMAILHPEAKFEIAGAREHTAAVGQSQGHQEIRTAVAGLISNFQFVERDILNTLIDGELAVVHSRVKLRFVPKNRTVTTDIVDLWKFENGKVIELIEFVDTALVNDLMR